MILEYINFFRQFAKRHPAIAHTDIAETDNAPIGSCAFAIWDDTNIIQTLGSKIKFPALLLETYEEDTSAENPHDVKQLYKGAFAIGKRADNNSMSDKIQAYADTEKIVKDCLRYIHEIHYGENAERIETPFHFFSFDKLIIEPIGPLFDNVYLTRCTFTFRIIDTGELTKPLPQNFLLTI
jgi:hypothetical protein